MATLSSVEEILLALEEGPSRLTAATNGMRPERLQIPPGEKEWSANDVLAHLRACSDKWGGAIERILAEDHPTFRAVSPRTWIRQTDYPEQPFRPSLDAFTAQREALVALLKPLPPEAWSRSATVTGAGRPLEQTVYSYAEGLARHERTHIKQVVSVVQELERQ